MTTPANGVGTPALHADAELIQIIFDRLSEIQDDLNTALTRIAAQDAEIADLRQDFSANALTH